MVTEITGVSIRAAQYVRMSTDHQKYSTANQSEANHVYAADHGMEIIRTYADQGRSGLNLHGRAALQCLLDDVQAGRADFAVILVYDVSRWGRFQDADESAHYEYMCRRAGIGVHYCAEQFENDGSSLATIVKGVKRAMAGEYSRELSVKTFAGQSRLVRQGYRQGGCAGYGMRRMLLDQHGALKCTLERGEHKSIASDRIVLVPGPSEEIETLRCIFSAFVHDRKSEHQIAKMLNRQGKLNDHGRLWKRDTIRQILQNEKYIGNNIWNRESFKLQKARVQNGREIWIRHDGAFAPVIDRSLFDAAQTIFRERPVLGRERVHSDDEMLERLRRLWKARGDLTRRMIDESDGIQSSSAYDYRFGSIMRAYQLIGFTPRHHQKDRKKPRPSCRGLSDEEMLDILRKLWRECGSLSIDVIEAADGRVPRRATINSRFGGFLPLYQLLGYQPDLLEKRSVRPRSLSDQEMLEGLRRLLREHGRVSESLIAKDMSVPSTYSYYQRFGNLLRA
jgi:DNA invertase Pin-like site-specific DNA recombinase